MKVYFFYYSSSNPQQQLIIFPLTTTVVNIKDRCIESTEESIVCVALGVSRDFAVCERLCASSLSLFISKSHLLPNKFCLPQKSYI